MIGGANAAEWHPLRGPSRAPAASPSERAFGSPGLPPPGEQPALVGPFGATGPSRLARRAREGRSSAEATSEAEEPAAEGPPRAGAGGCSGHRLVQLRVSGGDGLPVVWPPVLGVLRPRGRVAGDGGTTAGGPPGRRPGGGHGEVVGVGRRCGGTRGGGGAPAGQAAGASPARPRAEGRSAAAPPAW